MLAASGRSASGTDSGRSWQPVTTPGRQKAVETRSVGDSCALPTNFTAQRAKPVPRDPSCLKSSSLLNKGGTDCTGCEAEAIVAVPFLTNPLGTGPAGSAAG